MAKLISEGYQVDYLAMTFGTADGLELLDSKDVLGFGRPQHPILEAQYYDSQRVADLLHALRVRYDFVFTHSTDDRHSHHKMTGEASLRVFNCNIATYIAPWNGAERPNYFIELTEEQLEKKIAALACYKSQAHRSYMDADFIRSWARYTGIKCGKKFAEGFKVERLIQ